MILYNIESIYPITSRSGLRFKSIPPFQVKFFMNLSKDHLTLFKRVAKKMILEVARRSLSIVIVDQNKINL